MSTTRRDLLSAGLMAAGAAVSPSLAPAQAHDHDHDHQDVPSDPALRAKAPARFRARRFMGRLS
jgi:hypothetical protein